MRALLAVCTVLLNCSVACAQTASGVVRAMDGTPLEGVPVTIYGITVTTSPDGSWSASNPTGVGGEVSGSSWGRVKGSYRGAPPASGAPALRTMNTLTIDPTAQGYYKLTHEFAAPPEGYLPSVHPPADLGGVTPADVEWNILHSAYLPGNPLHWEAHANGEPVPVELVGFGAPGDRPAIQNIIGSLVLGNPGGQYLYPNSWEETWDTASATDGVRKDLFYEVDHVNGVTVKGYRIEKCASYCPYSALPISDGNGNLAIVYMTVPTTDSFHWDSWVREMWMGSSNMAYPSGVARSPPDGFNDTNMFDILLRYGFWYHRQHGNHALVFDLRDYAPPGR